MAYHLPPFKLAKNILAKINSTLLFGLMQDLEQDASKRTDNPLGGYALAI
jgi:hypothetical protein